MRIKRFAIRIVDWLDYKLLQLEEIISDSNSRSDFWVTLTATLMFHVPLWIWKLYPWKFKVWLWKTAKKFWNDSDIYA